MSIMSKIMEQRSDAAHLYAGKSGAKITGEGQFKVALKTVKVEKNRAGDADNIKLEYEVVEIYDGMPDQVGTTFTEYLSSKTKEDILSNKVALFVDQLLRAGLKPEKLEDEDDETVFDAGRTAANAASKFIAKHPGEVVAYVTRRESDKLAQNGKPYFNTYFEDPALHEGHAESEEPAKEAPKKAPVSAKEAPLSGKTKALKSPYAAPADDDD